MKKIIENVQIGIGIAVVLALLFLSAEPAVIRSAAVQDQHTISQTIDSEIAFVLAANDVTMNGSIGGITGGTSNGTTTAAVITNNFTGFTMTIMASSSPAMVGNNLLGATIADYTPAAAGIPDFAFTAPTTNVSEFGYSVSASSTPELALKFKDNGSACNVVGATNDTSGAHSCWYGLSTVATSTMVTTGTTSPSGATTSVYYKVQVLANASQAAGTYTATTTLTATTN